MKRQRNGYLLLAFFCLVALVGCGSGRRAPHRLKPPTVKPANPLVTHLGDEVLSQEYRWVEEQLRLSSTDAVARLNQIAIMVDVGHGYLARNDTVSASFAFRSAVRMAEGLLQDEIRIPPGAGRVLSNVYYNGACEESLARRPESALALLNSAVEWGFRDFDFLMSDRDLAAARSLPTFEAAMKRWREAPAVDFLTDSYEEPIE